MLPERRTRRWMTAPRLLTVLLALSVGASRETAGQTGQRSVSQLKSGTRVDATTTARLCIGASAPADTIPVRLTPAVFSESRPTQWPSDLTARIVRQRPDEMRHGIRFARFQIIRFGPPFEDRVGRFGLLVPEPEDLANPTGAHTCFPAGLTLHGKLAKTVKSSTRAK